MISDENGGLIIDVRDEQTTHLWLPDTEIANSPDGILCEDPSIVGAYRVGMPADARTPVVGKTDAACQPGCRGRPWRYTSPALALYAGDCD